MSDCLCGGRGSVYLLNWDGSGDVDGEGVGGGAPRDGPPVHG